MTDKPNKVKYNITFLNILITLLYVLEYHYAYVNFVIKVYGYSDLTFNNISFPEIIFLCILSIIPIIYYKSFNNVSSALSLFTYILIYIPFIETIFVANLTLKIRISYGITFLILMILFFRTDNNYFFGRFIAKRKHLFSIVIVEILTIVLLIIVISSNIHQIRFINILSQAELMYELRADNSDARSLIITYLLTWLSHGFIPLLLVIYYVQKKWIRFSLSIIAYIIIFMMDMQKITFLIPFVMWALLYFNSKFKITLKKYFHIFLMLSILIPSFLCCKLYSKNTAMLGISTLIILRTQCIAGEQLDRYLRFFEIENNPYTYYSHINVVNTITNSYPYGKQSIGQAVAADGKSNSNATFLLMDGVAAIGLTGAIISGILFVLFKGIMNSLGRRYNEMYIIIILLFGIFSMLNTSIFTSIFSFGFLIVYGILLKTKIPSLEKCNCNFK